jgi:hypothetical protein
MYWGFYFPIPSSLEKFIVPRGDVEIRLELYCDWIGIRTAKQSHVVLKQRAYGRFREQLYCSSTLDVCKCMKRNKDGLFDRDRRRAGIGRVT